MSNENGYKIQEFVAHSTQVNCLAFGPKSNQVLATGGEDSRVNIWRVGNVENIWTLSKNKSPIECLCFDSDEQIIVSGAMNGSLKVFDLNEGKLVRNLGGHQVNVTSIQFHPFGEFIVSGSKDCTMKVWDVRNKVCIQTYTGHSKEVTCVRFSPDGKWVASTAKDGQLLLWDLVAGKLINWLKLHPTYISSFEFNPSEFSLAGITSARTVKIWDLENMDNIYSAPPESGQVRAIAFSNLGSSLVSATKDVLRLWELNPTVRSRGTLDIGWDRVSDMKIINNTQLIAGSCVSNFASIWAVDLEDIANNTHPVDAKIDNNIESDSSTKSKGVDMKLLPPSQAIRRQPSQDPSPKVSNTPTVNDSSPRAQLNQVKAKLVQLSNELGLDSQQKDAMDRPNRQADDGDRETGIRLPNNAVDAKSPQIGNGIRRQSSKMIADILAGNDPPPSSVQQDPHGQAQHSKVSNNHRRNSSNPGNYYGDPVPSSSSADSKESNSYKAPLGGPQHPLETVEEVPVMNPNVVWDSDHSAQDMVMSMGESFWKRFKNVDKNMAGLKEHDLDLLEDDEEEDADDVKDEDGARDQDLVVQKLAVKPTWSHNAGNRVENVIPDDELEHFLNRNNDKVDRRSIPNPTVSNSNPPKERAVHSNKPSAGLKPTRITNEIQNREEWVSNSVAGMQLNGKKKQSNDGAVAADYPMEVVGYRHRDNAGQGKVSNRAEDEGYRFPINQVPLSSAVVANHSKCEEDLDQILLQSPIVTAVLSQRLSSLRSLRKMWTKGDIFEGIEELTTLSETIQVNATNLNILADFFESIDLKKANLSLDACLKLLPVLEDMISVTGAWTNGHVVIATYKSLINLSECFGELIRQTRSVISAGGVDISRETRLNKCNKCNSIFMKGKNRLEVLKHHFRSNTAILSLLETYQKLCHIYFS